MKTLLALVAVFLVTGNTLLADTCPYDGVPKEFEFGHSPDWIPPDGKLVSGEYENAVEFRHIKGGATITVQFLSVCDKTPNKALEDVARNLQAEIFRASYTSVPVSMPTGRYGRYTLTLRSKAAVGMIRVDRVIGYPGVYTVVIGRWTRSQGKEMEDEFNTFAKDVRHARAPAHNPFWD